MKKILYVTGSRAEYGIVRRLLTMLRETPEIQLDLAVTGMHCDNAYGNTIHIIEQDNFNIIKVVDININTTSHTHILHSMSVCLNSFGDFFSNNTYDAVMVLGDRYEIFSVAIAASMHNIPLIHIHGGEKTLANYDEFIRHSITKMSKLHLTSTEEYKKRVIQLGEKPGSVFNIGSLGAENALSLHLPNKQELELKYGSLLKRYFVVVFHPETLSTQSVNDQIDELLSAISFFKNTHDFIFIGSNADTGSDIIQRKVKYFCKEYKFRYLISIRSEDYLAMIKYSCGLIGNSSSGLIEVPSLKVATINIGDRQKGRVRGVSVIDVPVEKNAIVRGINISQDEKFISV
ncbi:TPA: UDP-N-acetylglucosamine 2-epimerase (hydrolyzing), partial [Escherichia coli]|nr:UDP-N-acetylglucosamine 2-epimerase (hydrolyzing) [Escherichia coli]EIY9326298.1 UDP-N-acetylglucosamine 2-epimerase (hydrolyzing) [Escherichia coli]EJF8514777.1 UDP-N-acetylglucosamine 2-epimerase (hydrolyzing) [Escherichia coli]EJO8340326.1 UDP-N-acetylglucosamine 2-epimerase (hydrolyzing) [Escherichia coli]HAW9342690.1 UDP-N-acetylglucosamine 2-epimerase (hydrolyzing) [Escherichia coli]